MDSRESRIRDIFGMKNSNIKDVLITPEIANEVLLKFNSNNRKISDQHVKFMCEDMKSGKWTKSNDNITFDNKWELSNGQHRLKAITMAGVPVEVGVGFGVDQNFNMDRGKQRTMFDNIALSSSVKDEELSKNKRVIEFVNIGFKCIDSTKHIETEKVVDFMNKYTNEINNFISSGLMKGAEGLSQAIVNAAFFSAYINNIPINELTHIREVLNDGIAQSEKDKPIIGARDKLMSLHGSCCYVNVERAKYVQYCINAVHCGRTSKITKCDNWYYKFDK